MAAIFRNRQTTRTATKSTTGSAKTYQFDFGAGAAAIADGWAVAAGIASGVLASNFRLMTADVSVSDTSVALRSLLPSPSKSNSLVCDREKVAVMGDEWKVNCAVPLVIASSVMEWAPVEPAAHSLGLRQKYWVWPTVRLSFRVLSPKPGYVETVAVVLLVVTALCLAAGDDATVGDAGVAGGV